MRKKCISLSPLQYLPFSFLLNVTEVGIVMSGAVVSWVWSIYYQVTVTLAIVTWAHSQETLPSYVCVINMQLCELPRVYKFILLPLSSFVRAIIYVSMTIKCHRRVCIDNVHVSTPQHTTNTSQNSTHHTTNTPQHEHTSTQYTTFTYGVILFTFNSVISMGHIFGSTTS